MTAWLIAGVYIGGFGQAYRLSRKAGFGRVTSFFEGVAWPLELGNAIAAWAYAGKDWE